MTSAHATLCLSRLSCPLGGDRSQQKRRPARPLTSLPSSMGQTRTEPLNQSQDLAANN